jgi:hypothetical protein
MRVSNYVAYISVSLIWLITELSLAQYIQYSGIIILGTLINIISIILVSYRPMYHKYLFLVNTALLTYVGFTIPNYLATIYSIIMSVSIVIYLVLIDLIELSFLLISLPIIYVSYIVERLLERSLIVNKLMTLIGPIGVNTRLFALILSWYLSLFVISIIAILLTLLLTRRSSK